MRTKLGAIVLLSLLGLMLFAATGCEDSQGDVARKQSIETRDDAYDRAVAAVPVPRSVNFPAREALAEYSKRQDRANHPYYVYFIASTGNVVQFFTSKTVPVSVCAFLGSTEDVVTKHEGTIVLTAPSLDGIFYGGAGASAACDGLIIFDQVTDGMLIVYPGNMAVTISDVPMELDLEPVRFVPAD